MKKIHLLICTIALVLASCTSSNEEKAEKLIKDSLIGTLYHPESYEPISTRVDSAFIDLDGLAHFGQVLDELVELLKNEQEYQRRYRSAESSMSIYAPNGWYYDEHSRVQYNHYKSERNEYKAKLEKIAPKIRASLTSVREASQYVYTDEFTCWVITHKFRSMNGANTMSIPGEAVFFCDIEFTRCGDAIKKETSDQLFKYINKISETENDEDLKELLESSLYSFF